MSQFSSDDLQRLRDMTFVHQIKYVAKLDSTNTKAIEIARSGSIETPLLVLTDRQTAGRGQRDRRWWSATGALTFSLVVADESPTPLSLIAGLAMASTVADLAPNTTIGLKWPNDVLLEGRKACGILVESARSATGRSFQVIGVGFNVNNRSADAPIEVRDNIVSLSEAAGRDFELLAVLESILRQLAKLQQQFVVGTLDLMCDWQQFCALTGKTVRITSPTHELTGICQGIDSNGHLLIATNGEVHPCASGTVTII